MDLDKVKQELKEAKQEKSALTKAYKKAKTEKEQQRCEKRQGVISRKIDRLITKIDKLKLKSKKPKQLNTIKKIIRKATKKGGSGNNTIFVSATDYLLNLNKSEYTTMKK